MLPQVVRSLQAGPAVIVTAPPGSGKTTRVPPALLDAGVADGMVLRLQPRGAAARLVARRIAWERGSRVGAEVGYSVRFERKTSRETRLEVLTEGLLTRRIQADPFLTGVGVVVLDEVHERSIHTDLALALLVEIIREAREDLKLVVMSATLDPGPLQTFMGPLTPVVRAEGRTFPVDVDYQERPDDRRLGARVAAAVRSTLASEDDGHVLVFLPGVREIRWSAEALGPVAGVDVLPLHGRLPPAAQDRALAPSARRKVVLSTNLAETSVTLDGVRVVIDSGLARVPVHDVATGLTRLETRPISRAAADQRAGRAGRTGPGRCHRMWTINDHNLRPEFRVPDIQRSDLASLVLEILAWGRDPDEFRWFESPPPAAAARAMGLLVQLGAVQEGVLT
ncbi:MAG: helicase-related protein, partial [Myxococcota bacterium]|nr:helicase-related protein [Myxococcota bacterium]